MATQWTDITESAFYGDLSGYIRYANQLFRNDGAITASTSNAMRIFRISENTHYRVTLQMRNRFRVGCLPNLTTGQTVTNYIYDPLDTNDAADQGGAVRSLEITSEAGQTYLIVGAWSSGASETLENTLNTIIVEERQTTCAVQFVDWNGTVLKSETVPYGGSATPPPDPTREGYTFTGWLGSYTNVTSDTTVTAQYVAGSLYTVQFVDWNGTVLKTEIVATGGSATPPPNPTRTGYTFVGWDGSYTDIQSDTSITATYTILTFTVLFKDWDGTVLKLETVDYGSDATPPADPTRNGYLFDHWNGTYTNVTSDTTVTAVYVIDPSTLTGIEITSPPTKTEYKQGQPFDGTGLVVSAIYSVAGTVVITDYTLSGFDTGALGDCTVTAAYRGFTADFTLHFTKDVVTEECGYSTLASVMATLDKYTGVLTISGTGQMRSFSSTTPLLSAYRSYIRSINILEGVTSVGSYAFYSYTETTSVTLPVGLISVNSYAFYYSGITAITLPSTVTSIGSYAFRGCASLVTADLSATAINNVPTYTFYGCTALTSALLPDSVTVINHYAFQNCSALASFTAPAELQYIYDYVFQGTALTSFTANDKLSYIGSYAFRYCSELTSLELPSSMRTISSAAFYETGITSIYIDAEYAAVSGSPWGATGATVTWRTAPLDYLELVTPPTKTEYRYGEELDTTGIALRIHYTDGSYAPVESFTTSGFDEYIVGQQTVAVIYRTVRTYFNVTVSNYVVGIEITTPPTKTNYYPGETLDPTGLVVSKVYADETTEATSDYTLSAIDTSITGVQNITVTSGEFTAFFTITGHYTVTLASLLGNTNGMTAIRDNVQNTSTADELAGADWFKYNGVTADRLYVHGYGYVGFGSNAQHLNAFYRSGGATYYVYRLEGTLTNGHRFVKIRVEGTTYRYYYTDYYRYGYELFLFDDESMFLNVLQTPTSSSYIGTSSLVCGGTTQPLAITAGTQPDFSFYASDSTGAVWIIEELPHEYLITGLSVTPPAKTSYAYNEAFDPAGMTVYLAVDDGEDIELTDYTLSGFDSSTAGVKPITVSWREYSATFDVTVFTSVTAEIGSPNPSDITASLDMITGELTVTGAGAIMNFTDASLFGEYKSYARNVTLSDGITSVGNLAFSEYPECTITLPSSLTVVGEGAFSMSGFTNLAVPPTITSIGEMAFYGSAIISVTLPSTLTVIGTGAFGDCPALTSATIHGNISSLPASLFAGCEALAEVTIGNGVTTIDATAFTECDALLDIWIDDRRDAFTGSPWGAVNASVTWTQGGLYVIWLDWDDTELKRQIVDYLEAGEPPAAPTRDGYLFTGWDKAYQEIVRDTTLHAEYLLQSIYLVEFHDYDGRLLKSEYLVQGGAATPPEAPSRDGYSFAGWDTDYTHIYGNTTITATYTERTEEYTVTFKGWDGTILKEEAVVYGHAATAPTPPERENYYFLSWSRSFGFITADTVTVAQYRECRTRTAAEVFNGETKVGEIQKVTDCTIARKLNGECTLSLSTLASLGSFVQPQYKLEIGGLIFDIVGIDKQIKSGTYQISINGEHVSYILNNEEYCINSFDFTGAPAVCLAKLLEGTPFSVGTVDYTASVTLKINKEGTTRRDAVMQLLALCGGEIEYDGYSIGIRSHVGSSERVYLMDTLNVKDVSMSYDARSGAESYSIQLFKRVTLSVGDEVNITFTPLGIDTNKRITEISYSPFNVYHIDVTLGSYRPTLSDSLYTVSQQTNSNSVDTTNLENRLSDMEYTMDTLSNSANVGGFRVKSVRELPLRPDENTIYLIQGEVVVE